MSRNGDDVKTAQKAVNWNAGWSEGEWFRGSLVPSTVNVRKLRFPFIVDIDVPGIPRRGLQITNRDQFHQWHEWTKNEFIMIYKNSRLWHFDASNSTIDRTNNHITLRGSPLHGYWTTAVHPTDPAILILTHFHPI